MAISNVALTSAMRANLYSLQKTTDLMGITQNRLSTGKRVNSALDDPVNYFAAQGHLQRASDLAFRKGEMGEGIQTIKAADAGIEAITDLIASAKSVAQSALSAETTTEINNLETQFNELRGQIDSLADDSGYKGINLLGSDLLTVNFDETGDSSITVTGFDASTDATTGLNIATVAADGWVDTDYSADATAINTSITALDDARVVLRSESKTLSSQLSTITIREDFTSKMINTLNDGSGKLTDADMNEEAANMLMLQTNQALGTTSLSLASQAAQSVLRLF